MTDYSNIRVSDDFQRMTRKAIASIFLFILTYIVMVVLALGLTALCVYLAIELMASFPSFLTLFTGFGMIGAGVLVFIFLVKFIGKKHSIDRSGMIEITKEQEPALFNLIEEIVTEVKTDFPKKVYLSADVNAAVFYDSSFWSMFFPVKKNLLIGMGMVNTITLFEFRAILAHEFGHFSQKSMKVGSYVYNLNKIIHNILYDNKSYEEMIERWANFSVYFSFFILPVVKVVQGVQWVLKKLYEIINISHMGLSREMEFHADAIAAHVAGSNALVTSLLRMELADSTYNYVLGYYQGKIEESVKTKNLYQQQKFVMDFLSKKRGLKYEYGLPQVSLEYVKRYNKSKLIVKDQWASHPTTEERVKALQDIGINRNLDNSGIASSIFMNPLDTQIKMTEHLFAFVEYKKQSTNISDDDFIAEFINNQQEHAFDDVFNGYYDNKNPKAYSSEQLAKLDHGLETNPNQLYNDLVIDWLLGVNALENDIAGLKYIGDKKSTIDAFDYDGVKYGKKDCQALIAAAKAELKLLNEKIDNNDLLIYDFHLKRAISIGKQVEFLKYYELLSIAEKEFQSRIDVYKNITEATLFIHEISSFDTIERGLIKLRKLEKKFKEDIKTLLDTPDFKDQITEPMRNNFMTYLSRDWNYFLRPNYNEDALKLLFTSMEDYQMISSKPFMKTKKELLDLQSAIYKSATTV